jgi:hypothetical protein
MTEELLKKAAREMDSLGRIHWSVFLNKERELLISTGWFKSGRLDGEDGIERKVFWRGSRETMDAFKAEYGSEV